LAEKSPPYVILAKSELRHYLEQSGLRPRSNAVEMKPSLRGEAA